MAEFNNPNKNPNSSEFNISQERDTEKEWELEDRLYTMSMELYTQTQQTFINGQVQEVQLDNRTLSYHAIGTIEFARKLFLKYQDEPQVMETIKEIESTIVEIREKIIYSQDIEVLMGVYESIEKKIYFVIGVVLQFRKRKNPHYKWLDRVLDRTQIPTTPDLEKRLAKKKRS